MACLIFYNCQKDDDIQNIVITEEKVDRPVTVSTIPQNQFIDNNRVWSKIGALKTELAEFSKTSQNRTVHSNETGLSIDTDFATYIEFENGYHSYTFLVTNTPAGEGLQNILLSLQDDGSYKEFLVHYNITDDEIVRLDDGEIVNLINRYTMTEIEGGFSEQLFSKVLFQDDCTLMEYIPDTCSSGNHVYGEACEYDEDDGNPNTNPAPNSGEITITELLCAPGGNPQGGAPSNGGTPPPYNPGNGHGNGSTGGNTSSPTTSCKGNCVPDDMDFECSGTESLTGPSADLHLSQSEICFLLNNLSHKDDVDTYLELGGNENFAEAAVEAWLIDGEVDWENHVILDPSVLSNQKVKCVYDKLKGLSNTIFNDIIDDNFGSSKNAHIRFSVSPTPNGEAAFTRGSANGTDFRLYEIKLNPSGVANSSTLEIALLLIHESLHAELLDRCVELGIIDTFNSAGYPNFTNTSVTYNSNEELFALIVNFYTTYTGGNTEWNHNLFTILNYRLLIIQNLLDIHPSLNDTNNDFLTNVNNDLLNSFGNFTLQQLMDNVSWIGLEGTQDFINTIQNNPTNLAKQNYIMGAANTEYTNTCI
ncbi:hypothetical protein [Bizionia sp.]|uniref:hypothetical protein n=1 Tax=Bizionia sp. TaxID=1954480 RepID=UPI003A955C7C